MDLNRWLFTRRTPKAMIEGLVLARRGLRGTRARLGPVNAEVIDRMLVLGEVRALGIVAELDVAELLATGPATSADLAATLAVDADALDRLLHLLATTGCFRQRKDGRWVNTRLSKALRTDHPLSMRSWARFFGSGDVLRIWAAADESVRTGRAATEAALGHEFFEWTSTVDPEAGRRFNEAMQEASRFVADSFARTVDLDGVTTLCDVGGGTGALLAGVLSQRPGMRGVLFDLPEVVPDAAPVLAAAGVADRVSVVGGSFFDVVPAGADRHVLVSVVHDWDDERAAAILRTCAAALADGGRILVVEQVLEEGRPSLFARHTDLLMLVLTGAGRERTEAHFRRLFAAAGLTVTRQWRLATLHAVYELAP